MYIHEFYFKRKEERMNKYYLEDAAEVLKQVDSKIDGLTEEEAAKRLEKYGKNKLKEAEKTPLIKRFIESISDPMIIMLLVAAAIQAVVNVLQMSEGFKLSEFADVIVIMAVVIINTIMSLIQESKAEGAMEALMQMTASTSKVLRNNEIRIVKSEDIVVGDVIVFEAGDTVPADCRIMESHSLKAEEAALTGESVPVNKIIDVLIQLFRRQNASFRRYRSHIDHYVLIIFKIIPGFSIPS